MSDQQDQAEPPEPTPETVEDSAQDVVPETADVAHVQRYRRLRTRAKMRVAIAERAARRAAQAGESAEVEASLATAAGDLARVQEELAARETELTQLRERLHLAEMMALRAQSEKGEANRRAADLVKQVQAGEKAAAEQDAELERRQAQVDTARKVVEQAKAQVERARADMEQQRRRFARESEDIRNAAEERLLRELLTSLDNFVFAFETYDKTQDALAFVEGTRMIHRAMLAALTSAGLDRLDPLGEIFDPQSHDAVSAVQDESLADNVVAAVMRSGYTLRGKVLRPAMVTVNKLPTKPRPAAPPAMGDFEELELTPSPESPEDGDEPPSGNAKPLDQAWKFLETRFDD